MAEVAALVLAGGHSTRMGQDKALLLWDGVPLLQRVCQVASHCCESVYGITPWPDRYRAIVSSVTWLSEPHPGEGPLVALAQGLGQISTEWVWLLGCDLPQLQASIAQQWITQLDQCPADIQAVVPHQASGWEPLCGFYRATAQPYLQAFIDQGGRSFQRWLTQVPVQAIPMTAETEKMVWNCNSPSDLLA